MAKRLRKFIHKYKAIAIVLGIFGGVALISSGSAAWVLSLKAIKDGRGNVNIGVINDTKVSFSDVEFVGKGSDPDYNRISFDADKDDDSGRIRYDGSNGEHLSVSIKGVVNSYRYVTSLSYDLTIPESVKDAIAKGYIMVNTGDTYSEALDPTLHPQRFIATKIKDKYGNDTGDASFLVTVGFNWGVKFGYINPSLYYDQEEMVKKYPELSTVTEEINEFRRVMYGYSEGETVPENPRDIEFTVTLMADTSLGGL